MQKKNRFFESYN